jgi:PEP-CTERM motif
MKHNSAIATALFVGFLFESSVVSATPIIDQEFIPNSGTLAEASIQPGASGPSYGQTFTVGISGRLVGADLALDAVRPGRALNNVLVEVTTTLGGFPTSTVLGNGTIPGASIPLWSSSGLFSHVDFLSAPAVTAGQQLALLFFGEGNLTDDPNILVQNSPDVLYPGGQAVIFASGAWHPAVNFFGGWPGSDNFWFRTYVIVPEPSTFPILVSGLASVGILRRRRKKA